MFFSANSVFILRIFRLYLFWKKIDVIQLKSISQNIKKYSVNDRKKSPTSYPRIQLTNNIFWTNVISCDIILPAVPSGPSFLKRCGTWESVRYCKSNNVQIWTSENTRVGTLIVATIYLQLIQNRYMFRSFTGLQCSHQHCVQPVASDVEVVGYL